MPLPTIDDFKSKVDGLASAIRDLSGVSDELETSHETLRDVWFGDADTPLAGLVDWRELGGEGDAAWTLVENDPLEDALLYMKALIAAINTTIRKASANAFDGGDGATPTGLRTYEEYSDYYDENSGAGYLRLPPDLWYSTWYFVSGKVASADPVEHVYWPPATVLGQYDIASGAYTSQASISHTNNTSASPAVPGYGGGKIKATVISDTDDSVTVTVQGTYYIANVAATNEQSAAFSGAQSSGAALNFSLDSGTYDYVNIVDSVVVSGPATSGIVRIETYEDRTIA